MTILLGVFVGLGVIGAMLSQPDTSTTAAVSPEEAAARKRADEAARSRVALGMAIKKTLVDAAKDPGSVDIHYLGVNEGATVACVEYRAKNSFGALVKEFAVSIGGAIATNDSAGWNKHCANKPLFEVQRFI